MKILLKLLSLIPFNNNKTKVGVILAIYALIDKIDPTFWTQTWAILGEKPINWIAFLTLCIGLIHKWLKHKYPHE